MCRTSVCGVSAGGVIDYVRKTHASMTCIAWCCFK